MRYLVLAELIRSGRAMSVAELVDKLRGQELLLPSRPGKAVSDALRWEVRKGRIVKVRWGIYRIGYIPVGRVTGFSTAQTSIAGDISLTRRQKSLQRWTNQPGSTARATDGGAANRTERPLRSGRWKPR